MSAVISAMNSSQNVVDRVLAGNLSFWLVSGDRSAVEPQDTEPIWLDKCIFHPLQKHPCNMGGFLLEFM